MPSLGFQLNDKVALVTGGTSGIGKAIAESLLDHGARVVIGSRSKEKVDQAHADLAESRDGSRLKATQLDVADRGSVDAAFKVAIDAFGQVDILVNCAGGNFKKPTLDVSDEDMRWIMDVNFHGPFYASQVFARHIAERNDVKDDDGGASIVNVCSVTSYMALSEVTPYACTKGALLALTRQLAVEWTQIGIRTNAIAPGFVPADQNRKILESGDRGQRILRNTPMERFGTPEEIAGAVTYLVSPAGRFTNGECVKIDGGFMINGVSDAMAGKD